MKTQKPGLILSLKLLAAKIVGSELVGRIVRTVYRNQIPWIGGRLFADPSLVAPRTCAVIRFGLYESAERRMIARSLRPGDRVIELGSSIGGISCVIHAAVRAGGRVGMVEARRELLDLALANVRNNFPAATPVSLAGAIDYSRPGDATISFADPGTNIDGRIAVENSGRAIPRYTLAEALRLLPGQWNVLVADIEGAEIGLILKDFGSLAGFDCLIFELHAGCFGGRDYTISDIEALIVATGVFQNAGRDGPVVRYDRIK